VNAVLEGEIAQGVTPVKIENVLNQSLGIEGEVTSAAAELTQVNEALSQEIGERRVLEGELLKSRAALSKSKALEKKASHSALHDAVTGLPNLALFSDRLSNNLAQANRHDRRLAVMFIDLDQFKRINDTYGHDAGDLVLKTTAERLLQVVRGGDTVSRRSGDEFLILMLEIKDDASVLASASRIAARISEPLEVEGTTLRAKASIGIALFPDHGRTSAELLKNADHAMYEAKHHQAGPVAFTPKAAGAPEA